jgi:hypothetical protein
MTDHQERPPDALAHGPVKSDDIERVRTEVERCDERDASERKSAAAQREQELRRSAERRQAT